MYQPIEKRVRSTLAAFIREKYAAEISAVTERPPKIEMGEIASPVCFELAKRLKRAPRQIAQEIASNIGKLEGVERIEIAGAGYLNVYLDRAAFLREASARAGHEAVNATANAAKAIVEHTNINPNKAAHIGHLRNAVLGDAFVRLLRYTGRHVEVQNYIDNTGVQVADVVLGFVHLENRNVADVRDLAAQPGFDYLCWDLYARVTQFLEEDKARLDLRGETLKQIERGGGDAAEMAEVVSTAIVRCHLKTMGRLEIEYDLLPRESEILHLKFWDVAFQMLIERGAIRKAASGKNAGCWVMQLSGDKEAVEPDDEADAKIIVRSNGTVTYVGKDIAYQLWKFGLLGKDFHYAPFFTYADGRTLWVTCSAAGSADAPAFGRGQEVFNVIDSRQAYPQQVVVVGLRALSFKSEADRSVHFSYEMVALTPRCAAEMGYQLSDEEAKKPYVEVSGRKGQGVKADDLLNQLEERARAEVDSRHPEFPAEERAAIGHAIAIGSLRYFLLKFTRGTIIAFDFKDALSFEGETGPYVQYAVVRARNIFRKVREQEPEYSVEAVQENIDFATAQRLLAPPEGNDLWELLLLAGSLGAQIEASASAHEPAFIAKYAFQLAQQFNLFYHKHHILSEEDRAKKTFLLLLSALVEKQLITALDLLGVEAPDKM
ncbi:MAG: arginine--tRNA ligase [Candidatus Acidiferrales bacterium]